jgi:hypothetical protein
VRAALACLLAAAALAGCARDETIGPEGLDAAARELVPPGADLVEIQEGTCLDIFGNPDCALVFLTAPGSEEARVAALVETARGAGWELVSERPRRDGTFVELRREGYRAFAAIREDERAGPCHEDPDPGCADEIQVIEDV